MARPNKKFNKRLWGSMSSNPTVEEIEDKIDALYEYYGISDKLALQVAMLYGIKSDIKSLYKEGILIKQQCLIMKMAADMGIPAFLPENVSDKLRKIANNINKLITFAKITVELTKGNSLTYVAMNKFDNKTPDALKKEYQRFKKNPIIQKKFYCKEYLQKFADVLNLNITIKDEDVKKIGNYCMKIIANKKSYEDFAKYKDILKGNKNTGNYAEQLVLEALSSYKF